MEAGDTFRFVSKDTHLWIVISDPAVNRDQVLIVNVTTFRSDKETTCRLNPGDHPAIVHNSCVNYAEARVYSDSQLLHLEQKRRIVMYDKVCPEILALIREGAVRSVHMRLRYGQILIDQGLVSD
jgi:hypothetical protein